MKRPKNVSDITLAKEGPELISEERQRQIAKGYTPEYDQRWNKWELLKAARIYFEPWYNSMLEDDARRLRSYWPWPIEKFRPRLDLTGRLILAGALFKAELDRLKYQGKWSKTTEAKLRQCGVKVTRWIKYEFVNEGREERFAYWCQPKHLRPPGPPPE